MSDKNDYAVLNAIMSALPAEMVWKGGRYTKRGEVKCPSGTLRSLAERGLVEVETRACSPWSFGPKYPSFYKPTGMTAAEHVQQQQDYAAFEPIRSARKFTTRSEVVAIITDRGIDYLQLLRTTRI